jgi:hypothetical protein
MGSVPLPLRPFTLTPIATTTLRGQPQTSGQLFTLRTGCDSKLPPVRGLFFFNPKVAKNTQTNLPSGRGDRWSPLGSVPLPLHRIAHTPIATTTLRGQPQTSGQLFTLRTGCDSKLSPVRGLFSFNPKVAKNTQTNLPSGRGDRRSPFRPTASPVAPNTLREGYGNPNLQPNGCWFSSCWAKYLINLFQVFYTTNNSFNDLCNIC